MFDISHYMVDGANWQAQAVAICIKGNLADIRYAEGLKEDDIYIKIGRYENCREQGYVIALGYKKTDKRDCYCIFEHRNSDDLCLIAFGDNGYDTPSIDEIWKYRENKYDVTYSVQCGQIEKMVAYIIQDMKLRILDYVERNKSKSEE